ATSDARAAASTSGGTGDVIGVAAMLASADENTMTRADVGAGVDLVAGSLDVLARATHRQASADLQMVQVSLLAGGSGDSATARVNGAVESFAGSLASRFTTSGDFRVRAVNEDAIATTSTQL